MSTGARWKVWPLGRNTTGHTQRKTKDSTKPEKDTDTEEDDDDDDNEEMPETTERQTYDTSERNANTLRWKQIRRMTR